MQLPILFENEDLLVVNKPAGLVVNRAETIKVVTVQDWMEQEVLQHVAETDGGSESWRELENWQELVPDDFTDQYGTPQEQFALRTGIVHRLDKDTSGALLLAKNPGSLLALLKQFRERTVHKEYTCLAHGQFSQSTGFVDAPLGRLSKNRKLFGVVADGRPAVTEYAVESYFPALNLDQVVLAKALTKAQASQLKQQVDRLYQGFSLVHCKPKTGRTHQIRVHLKHLQHPLVGDVQYVGKKRAKIDMLWCPRQFLHASSISFVDPRSGQPLTVEAPLADDLEQVLSFL